MTTRQAYSGAHTPDHHVLGFSEAAIRSAFERVTSVFPASPTSRQEGWDPEVPVQDSWWSRTVAKAKETWKSNTGLMLIVLSQFFFSMVNVAVKELNSLEHPVPVLELVLVRMAITWICCVSYMKLANVPDPFLGPPGVRLLLILRGFSGFFGLFGIYYSLQYLSVNDATVLTFLAPIFTGVVGHFILKEDYGRKEAFAGLFSFLGVVLIARPPLLFGDNTPPEENSLGVVTPAQRLRAVGIALTGVCGATGAYISLRAIGKRAHPLHSLVAFSSYCVVAATILIITLKVQIVLPNRLLWLGLLTLVGVFGFTAQVFLTMGFQRETATRGTMGLYSLIVFSIILEQIFFKPETSVLSIIGTCIIMASAIYIAITKKTTNEKERDVRSASYGEEFAMEEGLLENVDGDEEVEEEQKVDMLTTLDDSQPAADLKREDEVNKVESLITAESS